MIVTHINPDWDSICATWLLKRFGGMNLMPVAYVNTGNPDPATLAGALAVVDTGKEFDPGRLRFDHHQLPNNKTCATKQVYEYLMATNDDLDLEYLRPLIDLTFAGDTGRPEAAFSRELGIHAELSGYKAWFKEANGHNAPDETIMAYGIDILDVLEVRLRHQAIARAELAEKVVYKSNDGRVWAIKHGSAASSFAAQEAGAVLVIFEDEPILNEAGEAISYPVGVHRTGEATSPHVGQLVEKIIEEFQPDGEAVVFGMSGREQVAAEMAHWFKHNGGFFAGRGTGKALDPRPVKMDLGVAALLTDWAWKR